MIGAKRPRRRLTSARGVANLREQVDVTECTDPVTKLCPSCLVVKPVDAFCVSRTRSDGRGYVCRPCDASAKRATRVRLRARSDEEIEAIAALRPPRPCRTCKEIKGPNEYPRDRGRIDGRGTLCLVCAAEATSYYKSLVDPEMFRARKKAEFGRNREWYRGYQLKSQFGITLDEYRAMHEAQGGLCAICDKPERQVRKNKGVIDLAVDHDHRTRRVRQLLCNTCNKGLGGFKDSPDLLRRAASYIERHRMVE